MNEDIKNNLPEVIPEEIDDNGDLPSSSNEVDMEEDTVDLTEILEGINYEWYRKN